MVREFSARFTLPLKQTLHQQACLGIGRPASRHFHPAFNRITGFQGRALSISVWIGRDLGHWNVLLHWVKLGARNMSRFLSFHLGSYCVEWVFCRLPWYLKSSLLPHLIGPQENLETENDE